jgi:hypothetical protein
VWQTDRRLLDVGREAMDLTPAELWWLDGRRDVRRVDVLARRLEILHTDGHHHLFVMTGQVTADGYDVFVEVGPTPPAAPPTPGR